MTVDTSNTGVTIMMLRRIKFVVIVIYICSSCTVVKSTGYEVLVSRPYFVSSSDPGPDSNILILSCRDQHSQPVENPVFYLNDTKEELRDHLGSENYRVRSNELTFTITREWEGNFLCGPDQASANTSEGTPLVAYPLPRELPFKRITVLATEIAHLLPLEPPGALIQQYYIDWQDATSSVTLARIQGPRNQRPIEPFERYSTDPDTFALTINPVRFEDRGAYLGVIGVRDPSPGGLSFTYTQTQLRNITLEVYVPPTFTDSSSDKVVSSDSTTFSCVVKGYPQPTIVWYHNGVNTVDSPNKYTVQESVSDEAPFIVASTLEIINLSSHDSGNVTCVAMVTTFEGESYVEQKTSQLSVLGELADFSTFVTTNRGVIIRVNLIKPMTAVVQLFIQYTDMNSGRKWSMTTPTRYAQSEQITFIDETMRFQKFTVAVALVSGSEMGPLLEDPAIYDLSQPTELGPIIIQYAVPGGCGVLALLIIGVLIAICVMRKQILQCCLVCNTKSSKADVLNREMPIQYEDFKRLLEELKRLRNQQNLEIGDVAHGSPRVSVPNRWRTCRQSCMKVLCCETKREREARKVYKEIKILLQEDPIQNILVSEDAA